MGTKALELTMNGMIFAAGLGTRLAPYTNSCPKALVEVGGKPLLEHAIDHFYASGVRHLVVNVHHFAPMVKEYVRRTAHQWEGLRILISDESDALLDTGGGLAKALPLFTADTPIVVGNADVYSNAPIAQMMAEHTMHSRKATLLTKGRNSTRQLLFDASGRLCGWTNKTTGEVKMPRPCADMHESAFGGFHIIEPSLVEALGEVRKFPIIDAYLSAAADNNIGEARIDTGYYWFDVGTPEKLDAVNAFIKENE